MYLHPCTHPEITRFPTCTGKTCCVGNICHKRHQQGVAITSLASLQCTAGAWSLDVRRETLTRSGYERCCTSIIGTSAPITAHEFLSAPLICNMYQLLQNSFLGMRVRTPSAVSIEFSTSSYVSNQDRPAQPSSTQPGLVSTWICEVTVHV